MGRRRRIFERVVVNETAVALAVTDVAGYVDGVEASDRPTAEFTIDAGLQAAAGAEGMMRTDLLKMAAVCAEFVGFHWFSF